MINGHRNSILQRKQENVRKSCWAGQVKRCDRLEERAGVLKKFETNLLLNVYIFTQPLHHGQDVTQFLSELKLVLIKSFPSPILVCRVDWYY